MKALSIVAVAACLSFTMSVSAQTEGQAQSAVENSMIIMSDDGSGAGPRVMTMSSNTGSLGGLTMRGNGTTFNFDSSGGTDPFSLAQNSDVQKEIELVDYQLDQIEEINQEFSKRMQERMAELRDEQGNLRLDNASDLAEWSQKIAAEKRKRMQEVFLPHQLDRLQQISLQNQLKRRGQSGLLNDAKVKEQLGITDEQQKAISERAEKVQKKLEEDIERLREKARESILEELNSDQRKKLKEMMGDRFQSNTNTNDFSQRIKRIRQGRQSDN